MNAAMMKGAIKSFMKGIQAKPQHIAFVDLLFDVKWEKPALGTSTDLHRMWEAQGAVDGPKGLVVMQGVLNGKWIRIAVQTQDAGMVQSAVESISEVNFGATESVH